MGTVRYAVRKVSGRFDYIDRWCIVRVLEDGRVQRVKHTTSDEHDDLVDEVWRRNEALGLLNSTSD